MNLRSRLLLLNVISAAACLVTVASAALIPARGDGARAAYYAGWFGLLFILNLVLAADTFARSES